MNNKWILFSYSIPATNAKARMRTWRRISAIGAVQLKTGLQILPHREDLQESISWLVGEVNSLGGEAIALQCVQVEGMDDQHIEQLFQAQLAPEFEQIQAKAKALLTTPDTPAASKCVNELSISLRKLRKQCEALRERDFFPSGAAAKTLHLLDSIAKRLRRHDQTDPPLARLDRAYYHGRTWVTRARPFVDRLGSAWLIQRFIDPQAHFRFLRADEIANLNQGELPFDMAMGEFTHQGQLVTFEVLMRDFALHSPALIKISALINQIDLQADVLPDDAALLKTMLDGLMDKTTDDYQLLQKGSVLFEALHAGYQRAIQVSE